MAKVNPYIPPEVWLQIVKNLDEPSDLYSLSQVTPMLEDVLEDFKPLWGSCVIFPFLMPYLNLTDALKLRRVCRYWQVNFDRWVFEEADRSRSPWVALNKLFQPFPLTVWQEINTMRGRMTDHPGHRLIGGTVLLGNRWWTPDFDYWSTIVEFLKSFGSRITAITLQDVSTQMAQNPTLYHMHLMAILPLCPNLKKVRLKVWTCNLTKEWNFDDRVRPISQIFESNPVLPYLDSLQMGLYIRPEVQVSLARKYAGQLKHLEYKFDPDFFHILPQMINLQSVHVHFSGYEARARLWTDNLGDILQIPRHHIESVTLELYDKAPEFSWSLTTLLDIVERYTPTNLCVFGNQATKLSGNENPVQLARRLTSLKNLAFFDSLYVSSLSFLKCFPSLENITLRGIYWFGPHRHRRPANAFQAMKHVMRPETPEIRKFLYDPENGDAFYESNIWGELPKLKTFKWTYYLVDALVSIWRGTLPGQSNLAKVRTFTRKKLWEMYEF